MAASRKDPKIVAANFLAHKLDRLTHAIKIDAAGTVVSADDASAQYTFGPNSTYQDFLPLLTIEELSSIASIIATSDPSKKNRLLGLPADEEKMHNITNYLGAGLDKLHYVGLSNGKKTL